MIYGDASRWLPDLVKIGDIVLYVLLPEAWPLCLRECPSDPPREPEVNDILVKHLQDQKRRMKSQFEHVKFTILPCTVNPGTDKQGEPDICAFPTSAGGEEEVYLAYECKWIRLQGSFHKAEYTGENGMGRYLAGKYSPHVPRGNMIGYVVGGDLDDAEKRIRACLEEKGFAVTISKRQPNGIRHIGNTEHGRVGETMPFVIGHILLPYHKI